MESREEKFKKYREEIKNDTEVHEEPINHVEESEEEIVNKKNTLTMSIDQIIEAHDEYTTIIEKQELKARIKKEKKEKLLLNLKKIIKIGSLVIGIILIITVLTIIILKIMG